MQIFAKKRLQKDKDETMEDAYKKRVDDFFKYHDQSRLKGKNVYPVNTNKKKAGVAILMSDKEDSEHKNNTRDKITI